MVVESRLEDAPPVFGLIEPGDRHQEQMRAVGAAPQPAGDLQPVQLGEPDVEQDDVGTHPFGRRQGFEPVVRQEHFVRIEA